CFDQALALDPDHALAYAGLADACTVLAQYGLAPPNVLRPKARAAVQRALDLAPDLAEVHCASGALGFICDWDWPRAARDLRRAVELNPRYVAARQWLSYYLVFIEGRLEEGVGHAQRAVELDPLAPLLVMQLGMTLMGAGRYEEAAAPLKRAADLAPTMFLPTIHLGLLYNHLGRSEEAIAPLEVAVTASGRHPWTLSALAVCYSALGKLSEVDAISDELLARARREYVQSSTLAIVAAGVGRGAGADRASVAAPPPLGWRPHTADLDDVGEHGIEHGVRHRGRAGEEQPVRSPLVLQPHVIRARLAEVGTVGRAEGLDGEPHAPVHQQLELGRRGMPAAQGAARELGRHDQPGEVEDVQFVAAVLGGRCRTEPERLTRGH